MTIAEVDWRRAVEELSSPRPVALACHVDPDGDALGSMLALHRLLRLRGVDVRASWGMGPKADRQEPGGAALVVPPQYTFLPELDHAVPPSEFPAEPDVMVAFDCASPDRLGSLAGAAERARTMIVIDHHVMGESFGHVRLVDPHAAATAVLVEELIRRLGGELDQEMATCLYVGLVTDTGRFSYQSTTPAVMELGARLIGHAIDHAAINRRIWETHSFGYLKVLSRALARATLVPSAGLAWTVVMQEDLSDLGITMAEVEGLIDVLRTVEAVECAMVAKEQPGGGWKVSLRSKGGVDVGVVAKRLGGGGHAFASGFSSDDALAGVVDDVIDLLVEGPERPAAAAAGGWRS